MGRSVPKVSIKDIWVTKAAYARLYTIVASFCLLLSLSVHLLTQGGGSLADLPGLDGGRPTISAYFALMATGLLLLATGVLAMLHARKAPAGPALPLVGLGDAAAAVDPSRLSAKAYVGVVFVLFTLAPTLSLIHFVRVVSERGVVWSEGPADAVVVPAACMMGALGWIVSDCQPDDNIRAESMFAGHGRLRLAENRCDVAKAGGPGHDCKTISLSSSCEQDQRKCRGVDWLVVQGPLYMTSALVLGLIGFAMNFASIFTAGRDGE